MELVEVKPSAKALLIPPKKETTTTERTSDAGSDKSSGHCVVCQDQAAVLAIVDCGHLCLCDGEACAWSSSLIQDCAERIVEMEPKKCPICSTVITQR